MPFSLLTNAIDSSILLLRYIEKREPVRAVIPTSSVYMVH